MEDDKIYDLIVRYFSDNVSNDEVACLLSWRNASSANERNYRQLEAIWYSIPGVEQLAKYDKAQAYRKFMARVADHRRMRRTRYMRRMLRYAAVLVAVAGVFSVLSFMMGQNRIEAQFADIVVEAPKGSTTAVTLPDGSRVWINAGSRLSYSQGFGVGSRDVQLAGEGYFEVTKNASLPFSVLSGSLKVRVLGTKFVVRDYPEDRSAMVALREGCVALGCLKDASGREYQLQPNERAVLDKNTNNMLIESCNASAANQWTTGLLIFSNSRLSDIVATLSRSYNQRIVLANQKLGALNFYGTFSRTDMTLVQVLDALQATGRIHYVRTKKGYTIYGNNSAE